MVWGNRAHLKFVIDTQIKLEEQQYHDASVANYLENYYLTPRWNAFRVYTSDVLKKVLEPNSVLLDVGSGPYPSITNSTSSYSLLCCVDISKGNLHNLRKKKQKNCHLVLCDAETLPFKDSTFSGVICFGLLHHLPQPSEAGIEINRVLKVRGLLMGHEPSAYWTGKMESPHERGFSKNELRIVLSRFNNCYISTRNHRKIEFITLATCYPFRRLNLFTVVIKIWILTFKLEAFFDSLGIKGTDFFILCRKDD